ncbi:MAG: hypothetical protein WA919_15085 [Coleofasciculaceae cyanobacterium]
MKLSASLVAVKKISSKIPRSNFADDELEQAARLILAAEGVINPIIVYRNGLNSYEVFEGDFEYHAASKARELDPRKGEMIGAFIIELDKEEAILGQVKLLRNFQTTVSVKTDSNLEDEASCFKNMESRLAQTEFRLENRIKKLEDEFKDIKASRQVKSQPLDIFNNMSLPELADKLKSAGLTDKVANKIAESIENERNKQKFNSLSDVVARVKIISGRRKVKAISSDKMLSIIDSYI